MLYPEDIFVCCVTIFCHVGILAELKLRFLGFWNLSKLLYKCTDYTPKCLNDFVEKFSQQISITL